MPVLIPVQKLRQTCDPYRTNPWRYWERLTRKDVTTAIRENRLCDISYSDDEDSQENHVERIAYLVVHGWSDPIQMDVGVPSLHCYVDWPILDGNHRFAAAIYRREQHILASVGGSIPYAMELFGVDITETT